MKNALRSPILGILRVSTHLAWVGEGQGGRPQLHVDCLDISGYTGTFSDMCTMEGLWERTLIVMFSLKTYFF